MTNEISLLKKLKKKYGNITIDELIQKLEVEQKVNDLSSIKISCLRVYGKGCYELSGESQKIKEDLKSFIKETFDIEIVKKPSEEQLSLPEKFITELCDNLLYGEMGNTHYTYFTDIKLSHKVTKKELKKLLSDIKITQDSYEEISNKDFEEYFDM